MVLLCNVGKLIIILLYIIIFSLSDCIAEELCKFLEVLVPCLIWNRCELLHRQFRSIFHRLNTDRRDVQLNSNLLRTSAQLGQESCQFSAGGFLIINNETLGKVRESEGF